MNVMPHSQLPEPMTRLPRLSMPSYSTFNTTTGGLPLYSPASAHARPFSTPHAPTLTGTNDGCALTDSDSNPHVRPHDTTTLTGANYCTALAAADLPSHPSAHNTTAFTAANSATHARAHDPCPLTAARALAFPSPNDTGPHTASHGLPVPSPNDALPSASADADDRATSHGTRPEKQRRKEVNHQDESLDLSYEAAVSFVDEVAALCGYALALTVTFTRTTPAFPSFR